MASSFATTSSSASASASSLVTKVTTDLPPSYKRYSQSKVSFRFSPRPKLRFSTKSSSPRRIYTTLVKAQLNKVSVDGSTNAAAASTTKSEVAAPETKDAKPSDASSIGALATEESISEFITQVASLVKLVDSRDIVELQLKQLDCEVLIRKKEALPQTPTPASVSMIHSPPIPVAPPVTPNTPLAPTPVSPAPKASPSPAVKSPKSSHPPLKCPMAGTVYRSPAPGEPPFIKVGDKVQKGQVVCIIEAMKLMNEIEADQSGTVVDILLEDGKPVSVDTPLFVIEP
ncbi:Biotin carboxyl carrier protein of acetyl-CoA carboxylase [Quillaja saponaria]|uniref:Biotin carboxyl carrier protein of acetyl-CoA carboxylase n=1 Tax=Quillaja saponaria TaxID=32244 RepID=A0AAD7VJR8_QUISA|nr:Biotin carboxyl carrier protein of acetyl-CoA carboxylase [Quillaja saponaria]